MSKFYKKLPRCPSCNFEFKDENNFCPVCGQKNHDLKIPFKHLIEEIIENTLHLDSKIFKTLKFLVFKPGMLSYEFNSGKRTAYVPPVRLYILISFVFFFFLSVLSNNTVNEIPRQKNKSGFNFSYNSISSSELAGLSKQQLDSLIEKRMPKTNFNKLIIYQLYKVANGSKAEFFHLLIKNISYMMFILMPLLGAWIYAVNRKNLSYYIEGLIISIHFHGFVFLLFTVILFVISFFQREIFFLAGFCILPVYMVVMFKNYFKQKFGLVLFKTIMLGMLYFVSFIVLTMLTIVVSIILI